MTSLFDYSDILKYLHDTVAALQAASGAMTQSLIARRLGLDPGNFNRILRGERRLPAAATTKLADVLKLTKRESLYLSALIHFGQARGHAQKRRWFEEMISFREAKVRTIEGDQYEFYDKWYYTAVREVLAFFPYDGTNSAELGALITPVITPDEVSRAITLLERLRMISRNESGQWKRTDDVITTGTAAHSIALNNFVIDTMRLAGEAIQHSPGGINLSSVSLTVSKSVYDTIEEEVRACRRRILEMARGCENPDRVYQVNIQMFPLTKQYQGNKP